MIKLNGYLLFTFCMFQDVVKFEYDKTMLKLEQVGYPFQDVVKFEYDKTFLNNNWQPPLF